MWPFSRRPQSPPADTSRQDRHDAELKKAARQDGWKNILTKLGTSRDKTSFNDFETDVVTAAEAFELYRGDPLAARIVELLPRDANRKPIILKTDDKAKTEAIMGCLEDMKFQQQFQQAEFTERWSGGAALFPVINDGQEDLASPLNEDRIPTIEHFNIFEARELQPATFYSDPMLKKYGTPEIYRLQQLSIGGAVLSRNVQHIHESRLVIFPGIRIGCAQMPGAEYGWGDNIFTRLRKKLGDLNMSWAAAAHILTEFSQAIYKMAGFAKLMEQDQDDVVINRLLQGDLAKSILNAMVIGEEDSYERQTTPTAGLAEILNEWMSWFASSCGYPVTKLFGISPAGLNATGEFDQQNYDDTVSSYQTDHTPQRERVVQLLMLSKQGPTKGKIPEEWSIEYASLRTPSPKEEAERRESVARTDIMYVDKGIVSEEEVAHSRWGGDTYSAEMVIDWDAREKQESAAPPIVDLNAGDTPPELDENGDPIEPATGDDPSVVVDPNDPELAAAAKRVPASRLNSAPPPNGARRPRGAPRA